MLNYLMLTIHRDDHHCGSCWEQSDESDEFIIAETEDEILQRAAKSVVSCGAKRISYELRTVMGVEIDGSINILFNPVTQEYCGKEVPFEAKRISDSQYYLAAKAEADKAALEAKMQREKDDEAAKAQAAIDKERKERAKLEELKAKYEVPQ